MRRSYPKGVWDSFMIWREMPPLRCRGCEYRFYKKLAPNEKLGRPDVSMAKAPIL